MLDHYYGTPSVIPISDELPQRLYWTEDSGKIVCRKKLGTVIGIDHPGVVLGNDQCGNPMIAHHHYENIYPTLDYLDVFSRGQDILPDNRQVFFDRKEIVKRAILLYLEQREYNAMKENCQHFVNNIVSNTHYSESVNKIADTGIAVSLVAGIFGVLTNRPALVNAALVAGGISGATKVLNRKQPAYSSQRALNTTKISYIS